MRWLKRHFPIIFALELFLLLTLLVGGLAWSETGGNLTYALDDAYIHMAMAHNLATHGMWGVTEHGFTSTSSSTLWTLLLAVSDFLVGSLDLLPFLLNLCLATALLLLLLFLARACGFSSRLSTTLLVGVVLFAPLPTMVFLGLEHLMHTLLTLIFLLLATRLLRRLDEPHEDAGTSGCAKNTRYFRYLLTVAPLLTLARYEGLFLVFVVCCMLLLRREFRKALLLGAVAWIPLCVYGALSLYNGWSFFPNSVLLKVGAADLSFRSLLHYLSGEGQDSRTGLLQLWACPRLLIILLSAAALWLVQRRYKDIVRDSHVLLTIFLWTAILHVQFARVGWFYRYEAYLVMSGCWVVAYAAQSVGWLKTILSSRRTGPALSARRIIPALSRQRAREQDQGLRERERDHRFTRLPGAFYYGLAAVALLAMTTRGLWILLQTPIAMTNIYEQQIQMGRFLDQHYENAAVAVNDIGAVSYLADIHLTDVWGLADMEVARARAAGTLNGASLESIAAGRGVEIAVVYEEGLESIGGVPSSWIKVADWTIANNVVCGGDTVSFYALEPAQVRLLEQRLQVFEGKLPKTVVVKHF